MKKYIVLFCVVWFVFSASLVSAQTDNTPPAPERFVPICYRISNIAKYPSYVYLFMDENTYKYTMIQNNECIRPTGLGTARLYAIKNDYFDEAEFKGSAEEIKEYLRNIKVLKFIYREQLPYTALIGENEVGNISGYERHLKIEYLSNTDTLNLINDKSRTIFADGSHTDENTGGVRQEVDKYFYWRFGLIGLAIVLLFFSVMAVRKSKA